jgi:precorrin-6B methylase 2
MTDTQESRITEPPTPDGILQLGHAFWGAKTLLSAVTLGVFQALADGPKDGETLREQLGLHPRSAADFLDALVALGMLERDDGRYHNTAETDLFLDPAKPTYVGGLLEMGEHRMYPFWGSLTEALQTGRPQNEAKHGGDFFAKLYSDPERLQEFLRAMTGISGGANAAIAAQFPWQDHRTFIDVGCAEGDLPVKVAAGHPHISGGGYDLPAVQAGFEKHVASAGLSDRLSFHPGDFLADEKLPSADVVAMGHILHDWGLETKKELLRKAYEALPEGGALIVYGAVIDDDRSANAFGLLMSLNMLIETEEGFDYTGAECRGWMREVGFRETWVEPLVGPDSMVVGVK